MPPTITREPRAIPVFSLEPDDPSGLFYALAAFAFLSALAAAA